MTTPALKVIGLEKSFEMGGETLTVLKGLDVEIQSGERVAVLGQSGSGTVSYTHLTLPTTPYV